jgi:hypothetical protein
MWMEFEPHLNACFLSLFTLVKDVPAMEFESITSMYVLHGVLTTFR